MNNDFGYILLNDVRHFFQQYYHLLNYDVMLRIGAFAIVVSLLYILRNRIKKISQYPINIFVKATGLDLTIEQTDKLVKTANLFVLGFIIYIIAIILLIDTTNADMANNAMRSLTIFVLYLMAVTLLSPAIQQVGLSSVIGATFSNWASKVLRVLLFFFAAIILLNIWGIQVLPLLAGLGIFGVAVALGAQDLFKNLIAGFVNITEGRFHVGDVVNIEGVAEGTIESIGFRSTLVRRFDMIPVYVPNSLLSEGALDNYTSRPNRRIWWEIGVEYGTSKSQIENIITDIGDYLKASDDFVHNDNLNSQVVLDKFAASSIDILVICYTQSPHWQDYLDAKQNLGFAIMDIVERHGADFAFPSQSLYIKEQPN